MCILFIVNSGRHVHVDWMWAIRMPAFYDDSRPAEFGYFFLSILWYFCGFIHLYSIWANCLYLKPTFPFQYTEGQECLWLKLITPPLWQIPPPLTFSVDDLPSLVWIFNLFLLSVSEFKQDWVPFHLSKVFLWLCPLLILPGPFSLGPFLFLWLPILEDWSAFCLFPPLNPVSIYCFIKLHSPLHPKDLIELI